MVKIEEFLPIHFDKLVELHDKQESPTECILKETLPAIGFVVQNATEYVAFGFLRRLEGEYGQLDTFVTNPDSSPEDRNRALNLLTDKILKEAKILELRGVYVISSDVSILNRAVETGFKLLPSCIAGLSLR